MKGKGYRVTARNIASGDPAELARPLTTDPWDNALMYEKQEIDEDNCGSCPDAIRGGVYQLDGYNQAVITNGVSFAITTRTFGDNNHFLLEIDERCDTD